MVLHARVEVLDVLAHDDEVDALAVVAGGHARDLPGRPDVGVGLEQLAQRDVGALLAESDGRLERALEGDPGALDRLGGLARHARAVAALEHLGAGLGDLPVDRDAGRVDDAACGIGDLGADAVAGDEGDAVSQGRLRDRCGAARLGRGPVGRVVQDLLGLGGRGRRRCVRQRLVADGQDLRGQDRRVVRPADADVATGTPGIWTVESSASRPSATPPGMGTPITGHGAPRGDGTGQMRGEAGGADEDAGTALLRLGDVPSSSSGARWAEMTRISCATPSSSRIARLPPAWAKSERLPQIRATDGLGMARSGPSTQRRSGGRRTKELNAGLRRSGASTVRRPGAGKSTVPAVSVRGLDGRRSRRIHRLECCSPAGARASSVARWELC